MIKSCSKCGKELVKTSNQPIGVDEKGLTKYISFDYCNNPKCAKYKLYCGHDITGFVK